MLSRVKYDEAEKGTYHLEFELQVDGDRAVLLDLGTLLDTLRFAQNQAFILPLPSTWWDDARQYKVWPKLGISSSSHPSLEELDMFYAKEHAERAKKPHFAFMLTESRTDYPYSVLLHTLLQCFGIAEQMGGIPTLPLEWKARVMPPELRGSVRVEKDALLN